jgi:hypothetical protein
MEVSVLRSPTTLRALVYEAFELRETPYFVDAVENIVRRWERKPLTDYERELEERAHRIDWLIGVLRATDIGPPKAAPSAAAPVELLAA